TLALDHCLAADPRLDRGSVGGQPVPVRVDPDTPAPALRNGRRRGEGSFVTDTIDSTVSGSSSGSRGPALSAMRLPELQALAAQLGVTGTSRMRKSDLVEAIRGHQAGVRTATATTARSGGDRAASGAGRAATAGPRTDAPADEPSAGRPRADKPSA